MNILILTLIGLASPVITRGIFNYCRRRKDKKIINNFNKNAEKVYAEKGILLVKLTELNPKEEFIFQLTDFSRLEDSSFVVIENRLPERQYKRFAEEMKVKLKPNEDELIFFLDKIYLSQYMVNPNCIIWEWRSANGIDNKED